METKLALCIRKMAELGFGPTLYEMQIIVKEYINANEIKTPFKDSKPGYDWAVNFMNRHRLSLKKSGLMQIARKNVTSICYLWIL